MSQFIILAQNIPLESPFILKGVTSKVVEPSISPKTFSKSKPLHQQQMLSNSSAFLKSRTDKRFVQEIKLADQLQCIVMNKEYKEMKTNLNKYGKSKSSKIDTIMKIHQQMSYFDEDPPKQNQNTWRKWSKTADSKSKMTSDLLNTIKKQEKQAKLRYSIGNIFSSKDASQRVVFVDRKYNNQFAVKKGLVMETEQILKGKQNYQQFMRRYKKREPLVEEANAKRKKYKSEYHKASLEAIGILESSQYAKSFDKRLYRAKHLRRSFDEKDIKSQQENYTSNSWSTSFFLKNSQTKQMSECVKAEEKNETKDKSRLAKKKILLRKDKLQSNFVSVRKDDIETKNR